MKKIEETKKIYDSTPIPENLNDVVEKAIQTGEQKYRPVSCFKKITTAATAVAAAAICLLVTGLNTSQTFADSMGNLPVIGGVMQLLTIRSYEKNTQQDNVNTSIDKPEIVVENTVNTKIADKAVLVNEEIDKRVNTYIENANQRVEEYKEAFLTSGGTLDDWNKRGIDLDVSYEIKTNTEDVLSFVITCYESSFAFSSEQIFYNLNLNTGEDITLKDMLGEDYNTIIANEVLRQCDERSNADNNLIYWKLDDDMEMLKKENLYDPQFYINEAGNTVVVYPKYVVAPGYMGIQEFEIVK